VIFVDDEDEKKKKKDKKDSKKDKGYAALAGESSPDEDEAAGDPKLVWVVDFVLQD